ncbi:MAG: TIGR02206 family membrane protein [Spirochaetaceae bacterium]|mgnify:CR=1 FL=1|nr:TIGR02206 family membrane protein [Spirochaetaceae bacterium]|tara:strand:+ start:36587 stop:37351 length:765 start_codon:yes stop_codon:yes gene_type:complete
MGFFSYEATVPFEMFGPAHLVTLVVLAVALLWVYFYFRECSETRKQLGANVMAGLLVVSEISITIWGSKWFTDFNPTENLPLHLCGLSILLSALMLWRRSYLLFEILYFAGIAGSLQALITPYLIHGFPHFRFIQLFLSHGLIIAAVVFMISSEGFRPRPASILKSLLFLVIAGPIVGGLNYLMQFVPPYKIGNYFFLCYKPGSASLLDALPGWPYYLILMLLLALVFFAILYLPYFIADLRNRSQSGLTAGQG